MPRIDGTRQTGKRQHEWSTVAQTSRAASASGARYVEVDHCELCGKYRIFDKESDTETIVNRLPADLPELQSYAEPDQTWTPEPPEGSAK